MTNIAIIISKVKDDKIPVSTLLRESKILATKLNQLEMLKWIDLELNGYKSDSSYPSYRNLQGQVKTWNPFYGWVPVLIGNSEIEEKLSSRLTSQSIIEIETLVEEKGHTYEMPFPASISNRLLEGPVKTKLSLFIDKATLKGILGAVRDKILDWAIEIEKQGITGDKEIISAEEKVKVKKIDTKYHIDNIEKFQGNIGDLGQYSGRIQSSRETFWSKVLWYILVALGVLIVGNIISALIMKYVF